MINSYDDHLLETQYTLLKDIFALICEEVSMDVVACFVNLAIICYSS